MELLTFLLGFLLFLVAFWWLRRHDPQMPPFPVMPLPLVGHLLYLGKNPRPRFKEWREKCGNIYSLYFGQTLVVVLNGYETLKEVLVRQGDLCSDRPYLFFDAAVGKPGLGLIFSSGAIWKEQRAITMGILRALGLGKDIMAEKVREGVEMNNEILASLKGKPTDVSAIITTSVANIICSIIVGQKFSHDDENFLKYCEMYRDNISEAHPGNPANFFDYWSYFPGDFFGAKRIKARSQIFMSEFVEPYIKKHAYEEFDENNLDNFIALYMHEMKKKIKAGESTTMSEENCKKNVYDLFGAGMETSSNTLVWCVLYLIHYPKVQDKLFAEIEREVGTERLPVMSDKPKLPYLNAFILEVQRITSIVPNNVPRKCTEDIKVGKYTIRKGTQILPTLDSVLLDSKVWGNDVGVLKPERFLDANGQVKQPEQFIPFSMGRRACAGESMAKVEMFLFLSSFVQKFTFLPEDPTALPTTEAVFGFTAVSVPFKVRVIERIQ